MYHKSIKRLFFIMVLFFFKTAMALTEHDVSKQLKCQCGCGFPDLASCSCPEWAIPAKAEISARISRGEDLPTILKYFIDRHGETVLTQPVQEGFNHAAWIIPSLLMILGVLLVGYFIKKWKSPKPQHDPKAQAQTQDIAQNDKDRYLKSIDQELYGDQDNDNRN